MTRNSSISEIDLLRGSRPRGCVSASPSSNRNNSNLFISILYIGLLIGCAQGLECYECLSLSCPSGALCESIKKTMIEIFVPKRHVIHFDPNDPCPENESPINSTRWANLSHECQRSDSVCLVSPIEVISEVEGSKGGRRLSSREKIHTHGFLRGCASRRKLKETDPTIKVQVNLLYPGAKNPQYVQNGSDPLSNSSYNSNPNYNEVRSKNSEVYNMMNTEDSETDLSKMKFNDDYTIERIYSHAFYIDQDTVNATRCIQNNCNTKVRLRSGGSALHGRAGSSTLLASLLATVVLVGFNHHLIGLDCPF